MQLISIEIVVWVLINNLIQYMNINVTILFEKNKKNILHFWMVREYIVV